MRKRDRIKHSRCFQREIRNCRKDRKYDCGSHSRWRSKSILNVGCSIYISRTVNAKSSMKIDVSVPFLFTLKKLMIHHNVEYFNIKQISLDENDLLAREITAEVLNGTKYTLGYMAHKKIKIETENIDELSRLFQCVLMGDKLIVKYGFVGLEKRGWRTSEWLERYRNPENFYDFCSAYPEDI